MRWWRERRKVRLLIVYRTGFRMVVRCSDWQASYSRINGQLTELTMTRPSPRPAHMGIADIESVWRL